MTLKHAQYFGINLLFCRMRFVIPPAALRCPERNRLLAPEFWRISDMPKHRKARVLRERKHRLKSGRIQRHAERLASIWLADEQLQSITANVDQLLQLLGEVVALKI